VKANKPKYAIMFPYRFNNAGWSQKIRKIQQCRDTFKRQCQSALSISTTAFTNSLMASHTHEMLAATQKPKISNTWSYEFSCVSVSRGYMTHTTGWATAVSWFHSRKEQNRFLLENVLPGGKAAGGVTLTTNQQTVPRLRIDGVIFPPHYTPSYHGQRHVYLLVVSNPCETRLSHILYTTRTEGVWKQGFRGQNLDSSGRKWQENRKSTWGAHYIRVMGGFDGWGIDTASDKCTPNFGRKPWTKRSLGRPRCKQRKGNAKMDLHGPRRYVVGWIQLAQG
jgi:hypothetical protein